MSSRTVMKLTITSALVAAAVVAPSSPPAHADVSSHLGKASVSDSSPSKVVAVTCPVGTVVIGGGAQVHDGFGHVHVTGWMPVPLGPGLKYANSMIGYAAEAEGGYNGSWRVGASVLCGPAPAGLEYVAAHSAAGSSASRSVSALCPRAKRLLSGGARIATGEGEVYLTDVQIADDLSGMTAAAHEDATGFAGTWSVHAYAVCAYELPDHQVVSFDSASDSTGEKVVEAPCPAGTELHGAGAAVIGQEGHVYLTRVGVLEDWVGDDVHAVEADPGTAGTWSVRAYAICASD